MRPRRRPRLSRREFRQPTFDRPLLGEWSGQRIQDVAEGRAEQKLERPSAILALDGSQEPQQIKRVLVSVNSDDEALPRELADRFLVSLNEFRKRLGRKSLAELAGWPGPRCVRRAQASDMVSDL